MSDESRRIATVLVADGDEDNLCLLSSILALKGFDVLRASDGQEVVNLATRWRPDLILTELKLPIISGFTVIRRIKKLATLHHIPIIAVSLNQPVSHHQLALAAGCAAYLEKPVDFDRLGALIDQFLPGYQWELASALVH